MANARTSAPAPVTSLQRAAIITAIVAVLPYLAFKVLWLSGSSVGSTTSAGGEGMLAPRFLIGNTITLAMMVVGVAFVVALTRPWARRIPAPVVFVLGAGAAGLLGPILLGLPPGILIQALIEGEVRLAEQRMHPWVFGLVYAGFCALGVAMAIVVGAYVIRRWGDLLNTPPPAPSPTMIVCGALGILPFSCAMAFWAIAGPGSTGPQGMEQPAQRMVLAVTALLGFLCLLCPMFSRYLGRWPRAAWLVTWTGCCVVALQGPTQILLAQGGEIAPVVVGIAALATPGASLFGLAVLRTHLRRLGRTHVPSSRDRPRLGGADRSA